MSTMQMRTVSISPDLIRRFSVSRSRLAGMMAPCSVVVVAVIWPLRPAFVEGRLAPVAAALDGVAETLAGGLGKRSCGGDAVAGGGRRGQGVEVGEAGADERQLGAAEAGKVGAAGDHQGLAESAAEEVAEIAVVAEAAVVGDRALERRRARHGGDDLGRQQRDAFEQRLHIVGLRGAGAEAEPNAGGVAVPIGAGEAGKRGTKTRPRSMAGG